jgi:hypothetical protein
MTNYHAYLIRFWREEETVPWRATLVLPQTGEKRSFASVAQALAFITNQLADKETRPRNNHDQHQ